MGKGKSFILTIDADDIAWVSINVQEQRMNTLDEGVIQEFQVLLTELHLESKKIKGAVFYSLKSDNFIAGADINMIGRCRSFGEAEALAKTGQHLFQQVDDLPFPTVAAIHGVCLGGGLELALACDYRVCSLDKKSGLGLPEVKLGLLPGAGGTQRLPRLVGLSAALHMMLTGKTVNPNVAKKIGLIDHVVDDAILLDTAKKIIEKGKRKLNQRFSAKSHLMNVNVVRNIILAQARKQAQKKAKNNYPAIDAIIHTAAFGLSNGMEEGFQREAKLFGELVMSEESQALRRLFLISTAMKKKVSDTGIGDVVEKPHSVGVLGGGLMGAGICYVTLVNAKLPVRIKDISHEGILKAYRYCYERLSKKKYLRPVDVQSMMANMYGSLDIASLSTVDIVVEAVFEEIKLKQKMVAEVEASCSNSIFASNTSSLPIHLIAQHATHPDKVIGLHYFSPVEKMPLVEVIPHTLTSKETLSMTLELAISQGKIPIVVEDKAGFYINRILAPYMHSALLLLLSGEPIEDIDQSLVDFGFPVGPLTLLDEVGFDIAEHIMPTLVDAFGERFVGPNSLQKLLEQGLKGRKSGKGFYLYRRGKKRVNHDIYRLLSINPSSNLSCKDIAMRCLIPLLNEAALCWDEGVIANAEDGDIGAVFGMGFPPFLGGPFQYMRRIGIVQLTDITQDLALRFGVRYNANAVIEAQKSEDTPFAR